MKNQMKQTKYLNFEEYFKRPIVNGSNEIIETDVNGKINVNIYNCLMGFKTVRNESVGIKYFKLQYNNIVVHPDFTNTYAFVNWWNNFLINVNPFFNCCEILNDYEKYCHIKIDYSKHKSKDLNKYYNLIEFANYEFIRTLIDVSNNNYLPSIIYELYKYYDKYIKNMGELFYLAHCIFYIFRNIKILHTSYKIIDSNFNNDYRKLNLNSLGSNIYNIISKSDDFIYSNYNKIVKILPRIKSKYINENQRSAVNDIILNYNFINILINVKKDLSENYSKKYKLNKYKNIYLIKEILRITQDFKNEIKTQLNEQT
jgi:hypothetical protein